MMRAVRFASQLNFDIEPGTYEAIGQMKDRIDVYKRQWLDGLGYKNLELITLNVCTINTFVLILCPANQAYVHRKRYQAK